jgi:hypothetical protein
MASNAATADPSGSEIRGSNCHWMIATVIEDHDLMFAGKPLSTWYEEERQRQSFGSDFEQDRRGRPRERPVTVHRESAHQKHPSHHHSQHDGQEVKDARS